MARLDQTIGWVHLELYICIRVLFREMGVKSYCLDFDHFKNPQSLLYLWIDFGTNFTE